LAWSLDCPSEKRARTTCEDRLNIDEIKEDLVGWEPREREDWTPRLSERDLELGRKVWQGARDTLLRVSARAIDAGEQSVADAFGSWSPSDD
jgi:hypothetical protein